MSEILAFPGAGEIYSTVCALLWAISIIYFKKSGEQLGPVPLNFFKNTVALLLFVITLPLLGVAFFPADQNLWDWIALLLSGVIGIGIADTVFFASLNRLGAGRSAVVDCLYSPFIILCSFLYLDERMGPALWLALALMITGILIGTWKPEPMEDARMSRRLHQGVALGAISMFLMAVGIVTAKPVLNHADPIWASMVRLLGGVAFLALLALRKTHRAEVRRCFRPGPLWKVTMPAAVIGGYLAMILWISGMKYTDTTIAGVLNQLSTIFVLILATVWLREPLTLRRVIAIILGFGGAVLVAF